VLEPDPPFGGANTNILFGGGGASQDPSNTCNSYTGYGCITPELYNSISLAGIPNRRVSWYVNGVKQSGDYCTNDSNNPGYLAVIAFTLGSTISFAPWLGSGGGGLCSTNTNCYNAYSPGTIFAQPSFGAGKRFWFTGYKMDCY
jgi:hypothetical protein